MIDFENAAFINLRRVSDDDFAKYVEPMFAEDERIISTYRNIRDGIVFTNRRLIAINVQGVTGKKKDFTSMPYNKIQVYSVESAGVFDIDCELELWFSSLGIVRFEFSSNSNVAEICRTISEYML